MLSKDITTLLGQLQICRYDEHGDSLGNSGIIHPEMPQPGDCMLGCQLWINLPKKDKMTAPAYRDIRKNQIPVIRETGSEAMVISGPYSGTNGPEDGEYVKNTYREAKLEAHQSW
jgi:hypothetical protein